MKTCVECFQRFPPNRTHFPSQGSGGQLKPRCRTCHQARTREWQLAYQAEYRLYKKTGVKPPKRARARSRERTWDERSYRRAYQKARRAKDPLFRMQSNMRRKIRRMIKGDKNGALEKILGYTREQLKRHIEMQFAKGMAWNNYGAFWQLDHITPASAFSVQEIGDAEFKRCWALSNLRPLSARENHAKNNKRTHLI